jgi:hypothetical protein
MGRAEDHSNSGRRGRAKAALCRHRSLQPGAAMCENAADVARAILRPAPDPLAPRPRPRRGRRRHDPGDPMRSMPPRPIRSPRPGARPSPARRACAPRRRSRRGRTTARVPGRGRTRSRRRALREVPTIRCFLGKKGSLDAGHAEPERRHGGGSTVFYSAYGATIAGRSRPRWRGRHQLDQARRRLRPDTTTAAWDSTTIAFPSVIYDAGRLPASASACVCREAGRPLRRFGYATSPNGRD